MTDRQPTEAELREWDEANEEAAAEEVAVRKLSAVVEAEVQRQMVNMHSRSVAEERLSALNRGQLGDVYQTAADVIADAEDGVDFLVPRAIVRPGLTVVGGAPKDGKSMLATVGIIGPLERGEPTVFGDACDPVTTLVVSEEPVTLFGEKAELARIERFGFIDSSRLAGLAWDDKVAVIIEKAVEHGHELIFGDNLRRLAGASAAEENSSDLGYMVERLADAARAAGVSVLLLHHLRKTEGTVMERLRGGTALPGAADVLLAVERVGELADRRRRVTGYGRPRALGGGYTLGIELSEDGTTYVAAAVAPGEREDTSWQKVVADSVVLDGMARAVTAKEFMEQVNRGARRPIKEQAASNRLNELVKKGYATRDTLTRPYTWEYREPTDDNDRGVVETPY